MEVSIRCWCYTDAIFQPQERRLFLDAVLLYTSRTQLMFCEQMLFIFNNTSGGILAFSKTWQQQKLLFRPIKHLHKYINFCRHETELTEFKMLQFSVRLTGINRISQGQLRLSNLVIKKESQGFDGLAMCGGEIVNAQHKGWWRQSRSQINLERQVWHGLDMCWREIVEQECEDEMVRQKVKKKEGNTHVRNWRRH